MGVVRVNADELYANVWTKWVDQGGSALVAAARDEVGVDSGELQASIKFVSTGRSTGKLIATADHAVVHHEGHGVITPKNPDGILSWLDSMGGKRVYAKTVRAVQGNPFLLNAARRIGLKVRS